MLHFLSFYCSSPCPALRLDVIDNIGFLSLPGKLRAKISSKLSMASDLINSAKLLMQGLFCTNSKRRECWSKQMHIIKLLQENKKNEMGASFRSRQICVGFLLNSAFVWRKQLPHEAPHMPWHFVSKIFFCQYCIVLKGLRCDCRSVHQNKLCMSKHSVRSCMNKYAMLLRVSSNCGGS